MSPPSKILLIRDVLFQGGGRTRQPCCPYGIESNFTYSCGRLNILTFFRSRHFLLLLLLLLASVVGIVNLGVVCFYQD